MSQAKEVTSVCQRELDERKFNSLSNFLDFSWISENLYFGSEIHVNLSLSDRWNYYASRGMS